MPPTPQRTGRPIIAIAHFIGKSNGLPMKIQQKFQWEISAPGFSLLLVQLYFRVFLGSIWKSFWYHLVSQGSSGSLVDPLGHPSRNKNEK